MPAGDGYDQGLLTAETQRTQSSLEGSEVSRYFSASPHLRVPASPFPDVFVVFPKCVIPDFIIHREEGKCPFDKLEEPG